MQRPAKILVIRFSSIGDIVLTTPVLRALKEQLAGDTEVHYLTKKPYVNLLENNPRIHKIYAIDDLVSEVLEDLKKEEYDYVIDLHKNIRSAQVKNGLRKITFSFDKLNFKKFMIVAFSIDKLPDVHIVDRYLDALRGFGVTADEKGLEYYFPEGLKVDPKTYSEQFSDDYLCWVIGGAHEGKKMSKEKIAKILSLIPTPIAIIGGPEDAEEGKWIEENTEGAVNLSGRLTIHESAAMIQQSKKIITGDTGMMHVAAAFNKVIISLWGCTTPKFGMSPYKPNPESIIIEPVHLSKRPCSKLGNTCKYGMENKCIDQISDQAIVDAILK